MIVRLTRLVMAGLVALFAAEFSRSPRRSRRWPGFGKRSTTRPARRSSGSCSSKRRRLRRRRRQTVSAAERRAPPTRSARSCQDDRKNAPMLGLADHQGHAAGRIEIPERQHPRSARRQYLQRHDDAEPRRPDIDRARLSRLRISRTQRDLVPVAGRRASKNSILSSWPNTCRGGCRRRPPCATIAKHRQGPQIPFARSSSARGHACAAADRQSAPMPNSQPGAE